MANLTTLQRIIRFIHSKNIKAMKKWSYRFIKDKLKNKSWYIKRLTKEIRFILILISGFDLISMLKGFTDFYCIGFLKFKKNFLNLFLRYFITERKGRTFNF